MLGHIFTAFRFGTSTESMIEHVGAVPLETSHIITVFRPQQVQDGHPGIWEFSSASGVQASTGTWEYTYPE